MNQPLDPNGPDDLDRLLQAWATGREASAERLSALKGRIVSQLNDPSTLPIVPQSPSSRSRDRRRGPGYSLRSGPAWFLLAAASVLFIFAAGYWLGGNRPQDLPVVVTAPSDLPAGLASLPKEQLLAKARLFAEMRTVFGGQLQWIAETTDHIELGLAKEAVDADGDHPLMVHVVVERRAAGSADWKIVWATDVVANDQQPVVLRPTTGALPAALSLWAYRLPDGTVFVESDLTLRGADSAVRSASASILQNNRATEVGSVDADGAEYRIFQTAAVLDGDLG